MTLAALTFRPQEFAAGVDLYGVANWLAAAAEHAGMVGRPADATARHAKSAISPRDAEYLRSISPIFHAENIVKPLLVLAGRE